MNKHEFVWSTNVNKHKSLLSKHTMGKVGIDVSKTYKVAIALQQLQDNVTLYLGS